MKIAHTPLPDYLFHALLEALRRDLRREEAARTRVSSGSDDAYLHGLNARFNIAILECLMPRTASRYSYWPDKQQPHGGASPGHVFNAEHELADD